MKGRIFVGTSGYNYRHWGNGVFYPHDIPQRKWLEFYAQSFDTVELNVTFYRLPQREIFEGWYRRTPDDFCFAVKGNRFITHVKKLKECKEPLDLFFNTVAGLKKKLGIVLWQLPPGLRCNSEKLMQFCALISAAKLGTRIRQAFEFRHPSWFCDEMYGVLKKFGFSLCVAHSGCWPTIEVTTADFVYLRFHGGTILYGSNYSEEELRVWASKARRWLREGRDLYAYFNNDASGFAIKNSLRFKELLR